VVASLDPARITRTESQAPFDSTPIFAVYRGQQRGVPQQPGIRSRLHQSFRLPKQAKVCRASFQAQYQAFVRFAVGSSAALSHRAQLDLRFGTFHSERALALRTLAATRNAPKGYLRGQQPWTDVVSGT
jgi:hypothetical protein